MDKFSKLDNLLDAYEPDNTIASYLNNYQNSLYQNNINCYDYFRDEHINKLNHNQFTNNTQSINNNHLENFSKNISTYNISIKNSQISQEFPYQTAPDEIDFSNQSHKIRGEENNFYHPHQNSNFLYYEKNENSFPNQKEYYEFIPVDPNHVSSQIEFPTLTQENIFSTPYTYSFIYPCSQNILNSSKTQFRLEKEKVIRENLIIKCESFISEILDKLNYNENFEIFICDLEKNSFFNFDLGFFTNKADIYNFNEIPIKFLRYDLYNNSDKLAKILKICSIIYTKSLNNSSTTKRELYYNDVELFKNTNCIDDILQDICHLFEISRFDLTVFPAQKGLFAGNIKIFDNEGNLLNNSNSFEKINLISYDYYLEDIRVETSAEFILVVEKESIFFNLLNNKIFQVAFPNCIILTGKGYPDYMTKYFLHKICRFENLVGKIPNLFYFGDYDPHGIEIYLNYIFGSKNSSRDNVLICVNEMKWIGLGYMDIMEIINNQGNNSISLIKTDEKDTKKIECILSREFFDFEKWMKNSSMNLNRKFNIMNNLYRLQYELCMIKENGFKAEGETIISKYMECFVFILNNYLNDEIVNDRFNRNSGMYHDECDSLISGYHNNSLKYN